jgi:fatty acid metabolism transcriptional regulator FadR
MFTEINMKNLSDEISRQIINRILSGILSPGEKLPTERDMAKQMNVNRNTLREALRRLESIGLLNVRQGDGIYVRDYRESGNLELLKFFLYARKEKTAEIIKDILQVRRLIIPEMTFQACSRLNKSEINSLKTILTDNGRSIVEKDIALHNAIALSSDNLLFILMLNFFNDIFRDFGYTYFSFEENRNRTEQFHREIFESLSHHDGKKSREIMYEVLIYAESRILNYMEKFNEEK